MCTSSAVGENDRMFIVEDSMSACFDFDDLFFSWYSEHSRIFTFCFPQFSFLIFLQLMKHYGESSIKPLLGQDSKTVLLVCCTTIALGDFGLLFNLA